MSFLFAARVSLTHASVRSGAPIASRAFMTASLAPPWSGPLSVARAAVTAPWTSARVEAATRAANVEALNSWSAWSTRATSIARAALRAGPRAREHVEEVGGVAE